MCAAPAHRGRVGARRCAVQALYQWQLTDQAPEDIFQQFLSDREMNKVDTDYFEQLTAQVVANYQQLVVSLQGDIDRDWQRITPIERAALLIGAYELQFCTEIPRKVAINEAVELVKMFGAQDGHHYINAVLDKVSRRIRPDEPGTLR